MPTTPLLQLPDGLEITSVSIAEQELHIRVTSNRLSSLCPLCSIPSSAIHSYYRRKPLELPCVGKMVRLLLSVKKFFCRVASHAMRNELAARSLYCVKELWKPIHEERIRALKIVETPPDRNRGKGHDMAS